MHLEDHARVNFGGGDRPGLEMPLEAVIERVRRYTWNAYSCKLGGRNRVRLDEYVETVDGRHAGC